MSYRFLCLLILAFLSSSYFAQDNYDDLSSEELRELYLEAKSDEEFREKKKRKESARWEMEKHNYYYNDKVKIHKMSVQILLTLLMLWGVLFLNIVNRNNNLIHLFRKLLVYIIVLFAVFPFLTLLTAYPLQSIICVILFGYLYINFAKD